MRETLEVMGWTLCLFWIIWGGVRGRKKSPKSYSVLRTSGVNCHSPLTGISQMALQIKSYEWISGKAFNPESRRFLHNTRKMHFSCGSSSLCNRHSLTSFLAKPSLWFPKSYFSSSSFFQPFHCLFVVYPTTSHPTSSLLTKYQPVEIHSSQGGRHRF